MELEQRVQVLEQEVKLLKNEVQATLLDIQEQLLSRRYPALRAEAASQPETAQPPTGTPAPVSEASGNSTGAARLVKEPVAIHASPDHDRPSTQSARQPTSVSATPSTKRSPARVTTPPAATYRGSHNGRRPSKSTPESAPIVNGQSALLPKHDDQANTALPVDWEALSRQTDWTIQTVRKLGPERTRQLIELYTQRGLVSEGVGAILQRMAAAFQPEGVPAEDKNGPANRTTGRAGGNGALDKAQQRNIILRIIHYLQFGGAKQEAPRG